MLVLKQPIKYKNQQIYIFWLAEPTKPKGLFQTLI